MEFSVPFNGQADLLRSLNKEKVAEIYGKLAQDFIGGGRASWINPYVSRKNIVDCIREAHKSGIKFNYLFNGSCLGNKEWTRSGQNTLRRLLDWLEKNEVDTVTVTSPYLLEMIRKDYPFRIAVSSIAQIHSVEQARMWEEMGGDELILSQIAVNRNFPLLRAIRKSVKCKIKLIVNEDCFFHCPVYFYHANVSSHASQNTLGNYFLDYCRISCRLKRLADPVNFIRASWIRPEDVSYYENVGVDSLKIIDRGMATDALVRIVDAYTRNRYDGNLLDLLPHPSIGLASKKADIISKARYFFKPQYINVFKLYRARTLMKDFDVYIDNRALDGFLEFFREENCELKSCRECHYCHDIAKKAVRFNELLVRDMSKKYRDFLDSFINGDIFR